MAYLNPPTDSDLIASHLKMIDEDLERCKMQQALFEKIGQMEDAALMREQIDVFNHQLITIKREIALSVEAEMQRAADEEDAKYKKIEHIVIKGRSHAFRFGTKVATAPAKPPVVAECLTRLMTKPKLVNRVLDARADKFDEHIRKRGIRTARAFYWIDTVKSSWPAIKGLARWLIAGEFVRRWLGS